MKLVNLVWALFLCPFFLCAQNFSIKGHLTDNQTNIPIEAATVYVESAKDSTLITYTITNAKGNFELIGSSSQKIVRLLISSIGYASYKKQIDISAKDVDLGNIKLDLEIESLDEIVVKSRAPVTIKRDTLEFNASSFKTKKDASVEDLLKELPGVEVTNDGKILVNGKEVNKILVNGKPFFGDDPTIATRNLTKDIVKKIQVTDTKTKEEALTGDTSQEDQKTINITIDKDKNKGIFGRVAAGIGNYERYTAGGILNLFDNDRRLSVLAGSNNINSPGFSSDEVGKGFGYQGRRNVIWDRNDNGITTSNNTGVNFTDNFGKTSVTGNYFYKNTDFENDRVSDRETILTDRRFSTFTENRTRNHEENHEAEVEFSVEVDSTLRFTFEPSFKLNTKDNTRSSQNLSFDEAGNLINETRVGEFSEDTNKQFENSFGGAKKIGSKGASFRFYLNSEFADTNETSFVNSTTTIFGDTSNITERDQKTDVAGSDRDLYSYTQYKHPIVAKKLFIGATYSYSLRTRENLRSTFDYDTAQGTYTIFNEDQSVDYRFQVRKRTPGLSMYYETKKIRFNTGVSSASASLSNLDRLRELDFEKDFDFLEMYGYFNYKINPKTNLRMYFGVYNRVPQIDQLQPIQDVRNPLNIVTGNPNLSPEQFSYFDLSFSSNNFQKKTGFNLNFSATVEEDNIQRITIVDENLIRNTTYTNVDGNYRLRGRISKNKTFKLDSVRSLKIDLGVRPRFEKSVNFNNETRYASLNTSLEPYVEFNFKWKKVIDFKPRYQLSYTQSKFDIDNFEDQDFVRHAATLKSTVYLAPKLEWYNDVQYTYNPNVGPGFQKDAWFWNTSIAYSMLQNKGTLAFKIYDVLDQNLNVRRIARNDYIEDVRNTVLQQYFMLSFSYKFNTLGKKGEVKSNRI